MKHVKLFESFVNDKEISTWEKEVGKLPIPKKIKGISKEMAKAGFIRKDTKSVQAKLWIGLEGISWIEMKEKFGDIVGKFYGGQFYQAMTNPMAEKSAYYAYEVSKHVEDLVANDESIEPAYYMMKNYFNSFELKIDRNNVFDRAVKELEAWMKQNKINTL
jgi:hypothetical protein